MSFLDHILFPFVAFGHMVRTSGPDITPATIQRFFTAKHGNKERFGGILTAFATDPFILQKIGQSAEGAYKSLSDGKLLIIRDFDLFVRCSVELGHRGDATPELHFRAFPYDSFSAMPERYGACPYGKWEDYKDTSPYMVSLDLFSKQIPIMDKIIDDHLEQYIGQREEVGKIMRLLIWNLLSYITYGILPSSVTAALLKESDDNMGEFDHAVRMTGLNVPYEWSPSLTARMDNLKQWSIGVVEDRVANIDDYANEPVTDILTDHILNRPHIVKELEGQVRGTFSFGHNNVHCSISGALVFNSLNKDKVYHYLMQNPEQNIDRIIRESMRLYTAVPTSRTVREEDDFELDGKKLETGTVVMLSTYVVNTDPRSWENPMEFDPDRFENIDEIGYMTQRGFAPFGVRADGMGSEGRPCGGRLFSVHVIGTVLNKVLRDYKFTPSGGGYFDFQQHCGGCRYKGNCVVKVEKR